MSIKEHEDWAKQIGDAELLQEAQKLVSNLGIIQCRIDFQAAVQTGIEKRGLKFLSKASLVLHWGGARIGLSKSNF